MKKKLGTLLLLAFMLCALSGCVIDSEPNNLCVMSLNNYYDYAYISLPNGDVVEGKIQEWSYFTHSDKIQVKIEDKTYLTDTTRCVLVCIEEVR